MRIVASMACDSSITAQSIIPMIRPFLANEIFCRFSTHTCDEGQELVLPWAPDGLPARARPAAAVVMVRIVGGQHMVALIHEALLALARRQVLVGGEPAQAVVVVALQGLRAVLDAREPPKRVVFELQAQRIGNLHVAAVAIESVFRPSLRV